MSLAFVASQRSIDPSTKHGCVIIASDRKILSIGYNGPPRGADETRVPLTRPEKYHFMAHAEANAIDNCNDDLKGSIVYVTGVPCSACLLRLIQRGVGMIVYGLVGSNCCDQADALKSAQLLYAMGERAPKMVPYESDEYVQVLKGTLDYIQQKCARLPSKVDLRDKMGPVYDQGQLGSSTACAVAAAIKTGK